MSRREVYPVIEDLMTTQGSYPLFAYHRSHKLNFPTGGLILSIQHRKDTA